MLVVQSFAFSFRLIKVGSLIEWLLSSSFCISGKNPMLRILSFCGDIDVLLQGDPVVRLCEDFEISSTTAIDNFDFPIGFAVGALLFGRVFAKLEDLGVVQVGDQVLLLFAEVVDLLRLSQVLNQRFFILVVLELLINLLTLLSRAAGRLQKEVLQIFWNPRCCYRCLRNFESLDGSQDDLASWFCGFCGPHCEFDFITSRSTLGVK